MEYSTTTYFLALSLIFVVPAMIVVAIIDNASHEASKVKLAPFDFVSTLSVVGMAVICLSYRSEIFYVASNHLL